MTLRWLVALILVIPPSFGAWAQSQTSPPAASPAAATAAQPSEQLLKPEELDALVAPIAPSVVERLEPALLLRSQRVLIAGAKTIERAVDRDERALESGDGLRQLLCVEHGSCPERACEQDG